MPTTHSCSTTIDTSVETFLNELNQLPTAPDPEMVNHDVAPQATPQELGQTILDAMYGYTSDEYIVYSPAVRADLVAYESMQSFDERVATDALMLALDAYANRRGSVTTDLKHVY